MTNTSSSIIIRFVLCCCLLNINAPLIELTGSRSFMRIRPCVHAHSCDYKLQYSRIYSGTGCV